MTPEQVETSMLDGEKIDQLNEFLSEESPMRTFMLFYQAINTNTPAPVNNKESSNGSGNATQSQGVHFNLGDGAGNSSSTSNTMKKINQRKHLVVTKGLDFPMAGQVIIFTKLDQKLKLDWKNVANNITTQVFKSDGKGDAPKAIETIMKKVLIPSVGASSLQAWQPFMQKSINGRVNRLLDPDADLKAQKLRDLTVQKLNKFLTNLKSARTISQNKLTYFKYSPDVDWKHIPDSPDRTKLVDWLERMGRRVSTGETKYLQVGLKILENQVLKWAKTIQDTLNEASRMRKENTNTTGPAVELTEWKERYAGFAHLIEQIKSEHKIMMTRAALVFHKSKITEVFNEVDAMLTDANNQAMDNVRFLYSLEVFWQPLYGADIEEIGWGWRKTKRKTKQKKTKKYFFFQKIT